jgi:hypothetical protein
MELVLTVVLLVVGLGVIATVTIGSRRPPELPAAERHEEQEVKIVEEKVKKNADSVCEKAKALGLGDVLAEMKKDEQRADAGDSSTMRSIRERAEKLDDMTKHLT